MQTARRHLASRLIRDQGITGQIIETSHDKLARHEQGYSPPHFGQHYSQLPLIDFSRDVVTGQESRLGLVRVPCCGWNDLGTPERLARTLQRNHGCLLLLENRAEPFDRANGELPASRDVRRGYIGAPRAANGHGNAPLLDFVRSGTGGR